jgi:hypothetical protein
MPGTGTLTFSGTITGLPSGTRNLSSAVALASAVDQSQQIILASGFNSITVPSGATGCVITPPAGNAVALTLKGVTGDTGIPMHPTFPTIPMFATSATTFGITAAAATSGNTQINFF